MKNHLFALSAVFLSLSLAACAPVPADRYNTQRGAVIGGGVGALLGQAIGRNTEGTLIGLAAGTILGGLVGNAVDQDYQAAREAAYYGKPVIYYDENGRAVEALPEGAYRPDCRTVRKRTWENGVLVRETLEEVCGAPQPPAVRYYYPPSPPAYYGWWGLPLYPSVSFHYSYSRPYFRGHGYRPHRHYYPWRR